MRITQIFFLLAIAGLAQAWRFSLQDTLMSEPFVFLRSVFQTKEWPVRLTSPGRSPTPAKVSCAFRNLQDLAGCSCFVAESAVEGPGEGVVTQDDIDFCRSLTGFSFAESRRRCDRFRDSNGDVQVYRLIHNVFNVLDTCTVEKVLKETRGQNKPPTGKLPTTPPQRPTVTPWKIPRVTQPQKPRVIPPLRPSITPPLKPRITPPRRRPVYYRSGNSIPSLTARSGNPPESPGKISSQAPEQGNSTENPEIATSKRPLKGRVVTESMPGFVYSNKVVGTSAYELQTSTKMGLPTNQQIWGLFKVLEKIGKILVLIFTPSPSGKNRVGYLSRKYIIECTFKGQQPIRVELQQKAVRLMLYNNMEVAIPLVRKGLISGSQRMGNQMGVVKCKKAGNNKFKCVCKLKK